MAEERPNPDELLEQIRHETEAFTGGKLKIFFGYAAGVGKTYSMLEAARAQAAADANLVLGYVEPHARPETEALMLGMEILAPREVGYKGIKLREFDLDGALARKPAVIIVDELAHTNAPGLRHAKRWQDVRELLDAGVSVYTTLNVQHLESLNDIVAKISGIQVRETVPDSVFDSADSIELVDLPPEELLQRFEEGKVYVPADAERAMLKFFKLPNLIALRELALRRTADRVGTQAQATGVARVWAGHERLLVCVGPSPTSARLIRAARRMATALRAPWMAVYVDTGNPLNETARQQLARNMNLADQLGAETVTLGGEDVAQEVVRYARSRNVTKIIIGKTGEPPWRELTGSSVVSRILRRSGDIDVYVIRGQEDRPADESKYHRASPGPRTNYLHFAEAFFVVAICTALAWLMQRAGLSETNQVMVFIMGVAFVSVRYGYMAGVISSVASVLAFDFFFVPPHFTFTVADTQYFITFGVMLTIAILISTLTHRVRRQIQMLRQRQWRTEALYRLSRKLAATAGIHQLVAAAQQQLSQDLAGEVAIFLPDESNHLRTVPGGNSFATLQKELAVAQWVYEHGQMAGAGTDTLPDATAVYVPLICPRGMVGVLGLASGEAGRFAAPEGRQILEMAADQLALSIERDRLAEQARQILRLKATL